MQLKKFKLSTLLIMVAFIAIVLGVFVERAPVVGQSSTQSPDGNWTLNLRLLEYSKLFKSRRILEADMRHSENNKWDVHTSIPLNDADAQTISNQNPDHPIVWSDDSTTVNYWINDQLEDSIKIEVNDSQHIFIRKLNETSVTSSSK